MGWWVGWAGELTCDALTSTEYSAVARAVLRSTICHGCMPLVGLRQRHRVVIPLTVQYLRAWRRRLDSSVARDSRYRGIAFASNGVDGWSAERERKTLKPRIVTIPQRSFPPSAAASRPWSRLGGVAVPTLFGTQG
eukprot:2293627-Prymnesium_polylepis.2